MPKFHEEIIRDNIAIGSRIEEKRLEKDMTLKDLESKTNILVSILSSYEEGEIYDKNTMILSNIANALEVELDHLLGNNIPIIMPGVDFSIERSQTIPSDMYCLYCGFANLLEAIRHIYKRYSQILSLESNYHQLKSTKINFKEKLISFNKKIIAINLDNMEHDAIRIHLDTYKEYINEPLKNLGWELEGDHEAAVDSLKVLYDYMETFLIALLKSLKSKI